MNDHEIHRLISRYLDGVETPAEREQLDALIQKHPEVARELHRLSTQDAMLEATLAEGAAARKFMAAESPDRAGRAASSAREAAISGRPERTGGPGVWRLLGFWSAAAAAVVVLFLGVWKWTSVPPGRGHTTPGVVATPPPPVPRPAPAVIGQVVTVRGTVTVAPTNSVVREGDSLRVGDACQTGADGYLKYSYADGTVVELEANTSAALTAGAPPAAKAVRLTIGALTAAVEKQPDDARMTFTTPQAVATVVGTSLRLCVTPGAAELQVRTGKVELEFKGHHELVAAGESATVHDGSISKIAAPILPPAPEVYTDGKILFQDSLGNGFANWNRHAMTATRTEVSIPADDSPDIRTVEVVRDGVKVRVAELIGREPAGRRVHICTKPLGPAPAAFSATYEYTVTDRPRLAMEGIEIDMCSETNSPAFLNGTFTQKAKPPGAWNLVRWECVRKTDHLGKAYYEAKLFFNGELIGQRAEYGYPDPPPLGFVLEVVEGPFRFANLVIREMTTGGASVPKSF